MHGDERPGGPRAVGVDGAGQHPLAGAAFAAQQNGRLAGGRLEGHVQGLAHARFLRLQIGLRHAGPDLVLQLLHMRLQPAQTLATRSSTTRSWLGRERLGQVIEGAAPHRLDRGFDRGVGRDHDDRQSGSQLQQGRQHIEPLLLAQPQIEKGHVELAMAEQLLGLRAVARLGDLVVHGLQAEPQRLAQVLVVVDEQNVHGNAGRAENERPVEMERRF